MTDQAIALLNQLCHRAHAGDKFNENEALLYESLCRAAKAWADMQRLYFEGKIVEMENEQDRHGTL